MSKNIKIKPGKGQSAVGVVAGIVFCLIGVIFVIPIFGVFGVIWTLLAIGITVLNGMNVFSDKGFISHEIVIEEEGEDYPYLNHSQNKESVQERLRLVENLYAEGSITKEEYEQKRRKILDDI